MERALVGASPVGTCVSVLLPGCLEYATRRRAGCSPPAFAATPARGRPGKKRHSSKSFRVSPGLTRAEAPSSPQSSPRNALQITPVRPAPPLDDLVAVRAPASPLQP